MCKSAHCDESFNHDDSVINLRTPSAFLCIERLSLSDLIDDVIVILEEATTFYRASQSL